MDQINWSAIKGGDTIWIAGSTTLSNTVAPYTKQILPAIPQATGGTASAPISIMRATSSDPVASAPDWKNNFDSQVVVAPQNIQGDVIGCYAFHGCDYTTWDGRTPGGIKLVLHNYSQTMQPCGNGTNGLHWAAINVGGPQGAPVHNPNDNVTFRNFEMVGPYYEALTYPVGYVVYGTGVFLGGSSSAPVSNIRIEQSSVHGFPDFMCTGGSANSVQFDHDRIYDVKFIPYSGGDSPHPNIVEGTGSNITFSNDVISNWDNEGFFVGFDPGSFYIYGNVFDNTQNALGSYGRVISTPPTVHASTLLYFYNNTVINTWCPYFLQGPALAGIDPNSRFFNNVYWWSGANFSPSQACPFPAMTSTMQGHEYTNFPFSGTVPSGFISGAGASPFVSLSSQNYRLVSSTASNYPRNQGTPIANTSFASFNIDPDAHIRGADGSWDIGAFEYAQ
jgi:hypothetical protein